MPSIDDIIIRKKKDIQVQEYIINALALVEPF